MSFEPLREVVKLGGLALLAEDALIRAAVHHRGEYGGLVRSQNEKHHQVIVWRAVLPIWHTVLERYGKTDLWLEHEGVGHFFEMKNWRGQSGLDQLPAIRHDVEKHHGRSHKYILVTSLNEASQTLENFKWLTDAIPELVADKRAEFRFETRGLNDEALEFWIAGWPVAGVA